MDLEPLPTNSEGYQPQRLEDEVYSPQGLSRRAPGQVRDLIVLDSQRDSQQSSRLTKLIYRSFGFCTSKRVTWYLQYFHNEPFRLHRDSAESRVLLPPHRV